MARKGTCNIVAGANCNASHIAISRLGYVGECYSCGEDVCTNPGCSKIIAGKVSGSRRRICRDCQNQIDERYG